MSASARRSLATDIAVARNGRPNGAGQAASESEAKEGPASGGSPKAKLSVLVAADNRLLREALARMLAKKGNVEVAGLESTVPLRVESIAQSNAGVLLLTSRGTLQEDLQMIQQVRAEVPEIRILLLGMVKDEQEFLQCVGAGISGYLWHDASSDEVLEGVRAVHAGEAVCPGALCTTLFRHFESEAASMVCGSPKRRLGLTRREQQLVPLIAKGLSNKEIANHFSISEQTVKNHVYRMKQKTGAEDRLDIVQLYRTQGFLV
jgi:DNA-binding NarL/FixJ family response regulator